MTSKKQQTYLIYIATFTLFLSSSLVFLVQPLVSKILLPEYGGSSSVWITSLLFFQAALFLGYLYAFLLLRLKSTKQKSLHLGISLTIGVVSFLLYFNRQHINYSFISGFPQIKILLYLTTTVGPAYVLLASTSTLVQAWIGRSKLLKVPYKLYAISNIASLSAVVIYPLILEPFLNLTQQYIFWNLLFLVFIFALTLSVILVGKLQTKDIKLPKVGYTQSELLYWIGLPAISTAFLMTTTAKITQAVAPVPFLWLLPLGVFLLSYVISFSEIELVRDYFFPVAFIIIAPVALLLSHPAVTLGLLTELVIYTVTLLLGFISIHSYLYKKKPNKRRLELFYLAIAVGGVIGGIGIGVVAPLTLRDTYEYYGLYLILLLVCGYYLDTHTNLLQTRIKSPSSRKLLFVGIPLVIFVSTYLQITTFLKDTIIHKSRNFYTALTVAERQDDGLTLRYLKHGTIIHGAQLQDPEQQMTPLIYYSQKSGAGSVFSIMHKITQKPINIGVMGLGVGTIAALAETGDNVDFYEINSQVVDIAQSYFTYLNDSQAHTRIILGDARLSLRENPGHTDYDVLVMDAFSDDSIPMHLLTQEAFDVYFSRLDKSGVVLVNISNNYVNLRPVVKNIAEHFDYSLRVILVENQNYIDGSSEWAVLSQNNTLIQEIDQKASSDLVDLSNTYKIPMWTDNYSNLLSVVKR